MSVGEMVEITTRHDKGDGNDHGLHEDFSEYVTHDGVIAIDDLTGIRLNTELMMQARKEEIEYFKSMGVFEKVDVSEAWHRTGKAPIPIRWVDINKETKWSPTTGAGWWPRNSGRMCVPTCTRRRLLPSVCVC